ncbi:unnamed protein product [Amoebophrya sp. A120]|nr:unnamed protein product [Amoebophrya sp. A120]|eukprot:GSA120T00014074001.1
MLNVDFFLRRFLHYSEGVHRSASPSTSHAEKRPAPEGGAGSGAVYPPAAASFDADNMMTTTTSHGDNTAVGVLAHQQDLAAPPPGGSDSGFFTVTFRSGGAAAAHSPQPSKPSSSPRISQVAPLELLEAQHAMTAADVQSTSRGVDGAPLASAEILNSRNQQSEGDQIPGGAPGAASSTASTRRSSLVKKGTVGLEGSSEQTMFEKFQFAMAITSGSYFMVVAIGTKDIYLLEFGADATILGTYWIVLNFCAPFLNILFGSLIRIYAENKAAGVSSSSTTTSGRGLSSSSNSVGGGMNKATSSTSTATNVESGPAALTSTSAGTAVTGALSSASPTKSATTSSKNKKPPYWGQFGGWLLLGCILGSCSSCAMWLPGVRPTASSADDNPPFFTIELWFFITALFCWSSFLVLVLVYESSRVCLYPFKEERVTVEGFTKLLFLAVIVLFLGIYLTYTSAPSVGLQVFVAVLSFVLGNLSLVALKMVRRARQPAKKVTREKRNDLWKEEGSCDRSIDDGNKENNNKPPVLALDVVSQQQQNVSSTPAGESQDFTTTLEDHTADQDDDRGKKSKSDSSSSGPEAEKIIEHGDELEHQLHARPHKNVIVQPTASTSSTTSFSTAKLAIPFSLSAIFAQARQDLHDYYIAFTTYDANFWICLTRFATGCWEGSLAACGFFYITYVCELSRADRLEWAGYIAVSTSLVELVLIPFWVRFFSDVKKRNEQVHTMQKMISAMRGLDAVFMMFFTLLGGFVLTSTSSSGSSSNSSTAASPAAFLFMAVVSRILFSPFTYWRISAQCWCIDEHSHKTGKREEALFYALHAFWYEVGRGLIGSISFWGMGFIGGLKTRDCLKACTDDDLVAGQVDETTCLDQCYDLNLKEQPESLKVYLKLMYLVICPLFELLASYCIWKFPITGERLLQLYENQGNHFVKVDLNAELDSTSSERCSISNGVEGLAPAGAATDANANTVSTTAQKEEVDEVAVAS